MVKRSKIKKQYEDHSLVKTCIKITPCLKRIFRRYSYEKGKNANNTVTLSHGIRMAGVALMKKYGIANPGNLSVNYQ